MAEPIPVPPTTEADARNRAIRTFVQGLLIDLGVALVLTVGPVLLGEGFGWSKAQFIALGILAGKTVVTTIVSYIARKVVPPSFDPTRKVQPLPES